jgi:hypothetical protein
MMDGKCVTCCWLVRCAGWSELPGASAHMIPGAVGQHRIFVDTSADFSRFKPATTELVVL